jgi:hypothetical protein
VLQYLRELDCEWDEHAVVAKAAEYGHLSLLKWLLSNGSPFDASSVCERAAKSGSIEMMVYARQCGCELNARTMQMAAIKGRLGMCQYLHANGCAWDTEAPKWAAVCGHLDTLRWLYENGCPWDAAAVCIQAAKGGHIEVMQYLLYDLAVATPDMLQEMLNAAGAWEQLAAAQWLRQQGADWPASLQYRGTLWNDACLIWARQQGCSACGKGEGEYAEMNNIYDEFDDTADDIMAMMMMMH